MVEYSDQCLAGNKSAGAEISYIAPIYCYRSDNAQQTFNGRTERVPNLNSAIVDKIAAAIGLTLVAEKDLIAEQSRAEQSRGIIKVGKLDKIKRFV